MWKKYLLGAKALSKYKRSKMKRDAQQKCSLFSGFILVVSVKQVPCTWHYNPLLITIHSQILTIDTEDKIFCKKVFKNKEMGFKDEVKKIQDTACTGASTAQ